MASRSAVIFVSHNMQFVSSFCTDVMVLKNGRVHTYTDVLGEGISAYMDCFEPPTGLSGTGEVRVAEVEVAEAGADPAGAPRTKMLEIQQGTVAELRLKVASVRRGLHAMLQVYVMDQSSNPVVCYEQFPLSFSDTEMPLCLPLGVMDLNSGRYSFIIAVSELSDDARTGSCLCRVQGVAPFQVNASQHHWGTVVRQLKIKPTDIAC
jgi:energy-coupling factor transporter ATP-binding protein EcfA2